jgi:hypothetical protein
VARTGIQTGCVGPVGHVLVALPTQVNFHRLTFVGVSFVLLSLAVKCQGLKIPFQIHRHTKHNLLIISINFHKKHHYLFVYKHIYNSVFSI